MKIFPIRPISTFDRIENLYKIIVAQTPKSIKNTESDVVTYSKNRLLKGKN